VSGGDTARERELAALARDFPDWTFDYAADVQVWFAVSWPARQARPDMLAAFTLADLREKLENGQ
jgi:hypothetical protein